MLTTIGFQLFSFAAIFFATITYTHNSPVGFSDGAACAIPAIITAALLKKYISFLKCSLNNGRKLEISQASAHGSLLILGPLVSFLKYKGIAQTNVDILGEVFGIILLIYMSLSIVVIFSRAKI